VLTHALRASNCTAAGCESTVQRFVWDGDQLLYEVRARGDSAAYSSGMVENDLLDGTGIYGAIKAYGRVGYTHAGGIDRPIGAVRGVTPFYPHTNARGLYEAATVDNGSVLTSDVAWPGQSASAYLGWTPRSTPYQWFGSLVTEQADASGLLYRRNRYYDPKVGRFTQPDPIGIAGGLNSYGFASGDPVNYSDPFGLCPEWLTRKPCPGAVDVGAGFVPGVSSGIDLATVVSGENPLTGESVGFLGRGVAIAGVLTPLSGGQIRAAGKAVRITREYLNRKISREVRSADVWDAMRNPFKVKEVRVDAQGRPSQQIVGQKATVVQNPETGALVTTWQTSSDVTKKVGSP
jgi:RHS repeat-associated protein